MYLFLKFLEVSTEPPPSEYDVRCAESCVMQEPEDHQETGSVQYIADFIKRLTTATVSAVSREVHKVFLYLKTALSLMVRAITLLVQIAQAACHA